MSRDFQSDYLHILIATLLLTVFSLDGFASILDQPFCPIRPGFSLLKTSSDAYLQSPNKPEMEHLNLSQSCLRHFKVAF